MRSDDSYLRQPINAENGQQLIFYQNDKSYHNIVKYFFRIALSAKRSVRFQLHFLSSLRPIERPAKYLLSSFLSRF